MARGTVLPPPSSAGSTSRPISRSDQNDGSKSEPLNPLSDPLLAQFRVDKAPGATLDYDTPLAGNTKILGSSQILGCQGDFCNFDMSYLENPELSEGDVNKVSNAKELSEFRKKLLMTGTKSDFIDGDSEVSKQMKGGKKGTSLQPAELAAINADRLPNQKIAYRCIIQARQEMPLVKIALENHRKGVDQPYMREDAFKDTASAAKMPAHYYQDVPCCLNCLKVYSIVDNARKRALTHISRKRATGGEDESTTLSPLPAAGYDNSTSIASGSIDELSSVARSPPSKKSSRRNSYLEKHITTHQLESLQQLGGSSRTRRSVYGGSGSAGAIASASGGDTQGNIRGTPDVGQTDQFGFRVMPNPAAEESERRSKEAMQAAMQAINGLSKMDVSEIRSMSKPHPAVEVVMEAVMLLLTGRNLSLKEANRMMGGGEVFLAMLQNFKVDSVTDERLEQVAPYVDNPLFRPEKVLPISLCASKFCAWVHGVVHAARQYRGLVHARTETMPRGLAGAGHADEANSSSPMHARKKDLSKNAYLKPLKRIQNNGNAHFNRGENFVEQGVAPPPPVGIGGDLSFVQKLQQVRASRGTAYPQANPISRKGGDYTGSAPFTETAKAGKVGKKAAGSTLSSISRSDALDRKQHPSLAHPSELTEGSGLVSRSLSRFDPGPSPDASLYGSIDTTGKRGASSGALGGSAELRNSGGGGGSRKLSKREVKAMKAMQKKSTERLSAQSVIEGNAGLVGAPQEIRCADGITKFPYMVIGSFSLEVKRCSFIVVHDFFDTCDATAILFKPIVQRHDGCQAVCFNYPGQAHTVWPRLSKAEKERGAKDPIINNDWIADRMHELLQHAEKGGEILLTNPFHLVGIGNGASIAAAFVQKYGRSPLYSQGLRSVVSVNGFLYPDPQLSAILHSSYQVFESAPHSRPDIPVSYWSRFVFSDEYLARINPNLALQIYTAVSNPITNDGRSKITRGALQHRDMRGSLAPDFKPKQATRGSGDQEPHISTAGPDAGQFLPVQVPVIMLQATENGLVNASNVDSFLVGRHSKHLWSHMLNVPSENLRHHAVDVTAQWVGKMSKGPDDYHRYSTLGKSGLKMLLECLRNPRGAFAMWTRTGHAVHQEYKGALLDLLDVLACPTDDYIGMDSIEASEAERAQALLALTNSAGLADEADADVDKVNADRFEKETVMAMRDAEPPQVEVLFEMKGAGAYVDDGGAGKTKKDKSAGEDDTVLSLLEEASLAEAKRSQQAELEENADVELNPDLLEEIGRISYQQAPRSPEDDGENDDLGGNDNEPERVGAIEGKEGASGGEGMYEDKAEDEVSLSAPAPAHRAPPSDHPDSEAEAEPEGNTEDEQQQQEQQQRQQKPQPVVLNELYALEKPDLPAFGSKKVRGVESIDLQSLPPAGPDEGPRLQLAATIPAPTSASDPDPDDVNQSLSMAVVTRPRTAEDTDVNLDIDPTDHTGSKVAKALKEGLEKTFIADRSQQKRNEWVGGSAVPDVTTAMELEAELRKKQREYLELEARLKAMREQKEDERMGRIDAAQAQRREVLGKTHFSCPVFFLFLCICVFF